jgi:hypothetical protein
LMQPCRPVVAENRPSGPRSACAAFAEAMLPLRFFSRNGNNRFKCLNCLGDVVA